MRYRDCISAWFFKDWWRLVGKLLFNRPTTLHVDYYFRFCRRPEVTFLLSLSFFSTLKVWISIRSDEELMKYRIFSTFEKLKNSILKKRKRWPMNFFGLYEVKLQEVSLCKILAKSIRTLCRIQPITSVFGGRLYRKVDFIAPGLRNTW